MKILYKPQDQRYIFMVGTPEEMKLIEDYFNKIPQYMYLPTFTGIPKPEVYINKFVAKDYRVIYYTFAGMYDSISRFCDEMGIQYNRLPDDFNSSGISVSLDRFIDTVDSWNLNIVPRDYQYEAAWTILKYKYSMSELATRAGKTLISYMVFRYLMEKCGVKNILMIVPSVHLVKQGVKDFSEYKEFFKTETVWAKSEMCKSANMTIGTFQSLVAMADKKSKKYNPHFFDKFDAVFVDECHKLKCNSISTILNLPFMKNIKIKFGCSGTIPEDGTSDSFACYSLMGPVVKRITPHELVENDILARPIIEQIRIRYSEDEIIDDFIKCGEYICGNDVCDEEGKPIKLDKDQRIFNMIYKRNLPFALKQYKEMYPKKEYYKYLCDICKSNSANLLLLEQMVGHMSKKKNDLIIELLRGINKNCIVFAHHTSYIDYLHDFIKEKLPDKTVFKITGNTTINKRTKIIDFMDKNDNTVLVASYGCVGTGLTFKNVDYGIMSQSFKSRIISMQSIGRLMLKTSEKDRFYIYDLIDCYPTKRVYSQGLKKINLYKAEENQYEYSIVYR